MRAMHETPDLDLLRCFASLHSERHLTRAANRVGLSQPAMSRALIRLREAFRDPLFVRATRGMVPTPRADQLATQVSAVLDAARALVEPAAFAPAQLTRNFTIGSTDFFDADLMPRMIATMGEVAPHATLVTRPITADLDDALATGRLDLALGVKVNIPPGAMTTRLYEDTFVCAIRQDHPLAGKKLTLARFVELSHLFIAPGGTPGGPVDDALAARGLHRRIAARTHSFMSAPSIIAHTDLILTAPRRVIAHLAKPFGLHVLPVPLPLPGIPIYMMWHPRVQADPTHAWFRGLLATAAKGTL